MTSLYDKTKAQITTLLAEAYAICFNCDIWSSRKMRGYIDVSAHFIDKDWKLRNLLLRCPRFTSRHTWESSVVTVM